MMRYLLLLLVPLLVAMVAISTIGMKVPSMRDKTPKMNILAETTVNLGTTASFAVLAGSTITNTGATTINGDVGLYEGSSVTGFADVPPTTNSVTMTGWTLYVSDGGGVASKAKTDLVTAYDDAAGRSFTSLTPTNEAIDLGGRTIYPGSYSAGSSIGITGTLTLDAQGDPNAIFIFKAASTLGTAAGAPGAPGSIVRLINGARFCRVFWVVGTSATINDYSQFAGHVFAMESITAVIGATIQGQLLARVSAVTLDTNTITNEVCGTITAAPTTTSAAVAASTPTPTPTTASEGLLTVYNVDSSGNPIVAASQASVADFDIYTNEADIAANNPLQKGSTVIGTNSFSTNLGNGTYYVVEKSSPEGYDIDGIVRSVTISGGPESLTFINTVVEEVAATETTVVEVAAEENTSAETTAAAIAATAGVSVTTTVTDEHLPKTGTSLYILLSAGIILILIGAVLWITRKVYQKEVKYKAQHLILRKKF